jgi:putative flippase GtrA
MKWRTEFIRFALTGVITNALALCGFYLLVRAGLDPLIVVSIFYVLSVSLAFVLNKQWSFSHTGDFVTSAARYIVAYVICYILNMLALDYFSKQQGYSPLIVQTVAIIIAAVLLFLAQKFWIFRSNKTTAIISAKL